MCDKAIPLHARHTNVVYYRKTPRVTCALRGQDAFTGQQGEHMFCRRSAPKSLALCLPNKMRARPRAPCKSGQRLCNLARAAGPRFNAVNTAASGNNAAAIQSLTTESPPSWPQSWTAARWRRQLPLATAAALATTDGQVAAHGSSIAALQSSLTTGLSNKADQRPSTCWRATTRTAWT